MMPLENAFTLQVLTCLSCCVAEHIAKRVVVERDKRTEARRGSTVLMARTGLVISGVCGVQGFIKAAFGDQRLDYQ